MSDAMARMEEFTDCEKLWLLAGEMLRDRGIEDLRAEHLAGILGQTLACVAIHNAIEPVDQRTVLSLTELVQEAAVEAHEAFLQEYRGMKRPN